MATTTTTTETTTVSPISISVSITLAVATAIATLFLMPKKATTKDAEKTSTMKIPSWLSSFNSNSDNDDDNGDAKTSGSNNTLSMMMVRSILKDHLNELSGDSIIKIVRQLDFFYQNMTRSSSSSSSSLEGRNNGMTDQEKQHLMTSLTKKLVYAATWQSRQSQDKTSTTKSLSTSTSTVFFQVPKVRFGRTELQMSIITCGSMRFQHTWMPDFTPISMSQKKVIQTPSQVNLQEVIRQCLQMGINHFETARMYGSSEIQLMEALSQLIANGEIQRSDFILQTKLPVRPQLEWIKSFEQSWNIFEPLGYIDLLSFWCVSKDEQVELSLAEGDDSIMAKALEWKAQGKIKHIGFSTHGTASNIMKMINSNKFDYVNLHYHYFGSYHAEGTSDTQGGHGNLACVRRALELDMGVFNISPIDKGGRLYQPSTAVAKAIGPEMTPIAFANLYSWMTAGMHTVSVGFARPEDLTETLEAAELFANRKENNINNQLQNVIQRLDALASQRLGKEWMEKGLLNVPNSLQPISKGIGLGHMLWCYNMMYGYGMYDVAKCRYKNLLKEGKQWNSKKSWEDNMKTIGGGNPMRALDDDSMDDLEEMLKDHYNPALACERIREVHELLKDCADNKKTLSSEERQKRGWTEAYDLRPWHEFPDTDRLTVTTVVIQTLTRGYFGAGGGPSAESKDLGERLREIIRGN